MIFRKHINRLRFYKIFQSYPYGHLLKGEALTFVVLDCVYGMLFLVLLSCLQVSDQWDSLSPDDFIQLSSELIIPGQAPVNLDRIKYYGSNMSL